jgi:alanyl-tRNA synthetase
LEDVGYDTYHHTFFEMLGNWSFGDYFKKEAIQWSWELIVERWGFPAERLYATVYCPNPEQNDPGEFDQEAWDAWAVLFRSKGLDPAVHIVNGNVHDNFWMMGETGPCGPCSELHVDLTPNGDTMGKLVNGSSDQCIEIWNLVFMQYNAESDGTFRNLPAQHIDTGMGFERACSIIQCTDGFKDFSKKISNYATDVFRPLFSKLEELSGKTYRDIYPGATKKVDDPQLREAIAFRVIADHIRTLGFSIADGILPGNNGRNYVLRRILRRAVRYGRALGFTKPFMADLADTLVDSFGSVFPELKDRLATIKDVLNREETSFNETLDRGLDLFEHEATEFGKISGDFAFKLYDTFGFPIDLTALLAEERGLDLDIDRFNELMEEQRNRARAAQKNIIVRAMDLKSDDVTEFVGYDSTECVAKILDLVPQDDTLFVITDKTPFYAEMGGQVSDTGFIQQGGDSYAVLAVQQIGQARAHVISAQDGKNLSVGDTVTLTLDVDRRHRIEANHTSTHLLHKALHELVSEDASQQGSLVSEERLRFDFNSGALSHAQIQAVEERVNDWIDQALPVHGTERAYTDVKNNKAIAQFFGDKYGDVVRVIQVGGDRDALNGISMEFCGGTHIDNTGHIGLFKIRSEGAIASGVRRIEAVTGDAAIESIRELVAEKAKEFFTFYEKLLAANGKLTDLGIAPLPTPTLDDKPALNALASRNIREINKHLAHLDEVLNQVKQNALDAEKKVKKAVAAAAASMADQLLNDQLPAHPDRFLYCGEGSGDLLQELLNGLKKRQYAGAAFLIVDDGKSLMLGAFCGADAQAAGLQAGQLIQKLAPIAGGKGGGRPDQARGSAPQRDKANDVSVAASEALGLH